jgi:hypothetical protein
MSPEALDVLLKAGLPTGVAAILVIAAYFRRTPDRGPEHEETSIDKLRADLMRELGSVHDKLGDVRDRVSRIEGAIGRK